MNIKTKSEVATRFEFLPLGQIKPKGWILEQLNRDLTRGFAGNLDELTTHAATDLFQNRIQNNMEHTQWWDSETRGNWLLGYTQMAYLADDPIHKEKVDALLADLKATQDPDGYIGIYTEDSRYNHPPGENGELWGQGRALLTMLSYYELTGDASYLAAVEHAAQLTIQQYGPHNPYFAVAGTEDDFLLGGLLHGLTYVDVMEWLYSLTGNQAYRDFGVWLYDDFCNLPRHSSHDDMKLSHLLEPDLPLSGHAAHPAEHLRVPIWSYFMTNRAELKAGVDNAFAKLVRYVVPSGALIGDESIHGLPLPDMGYEYCTMMELMSSLFSAGQKFGRRVYGDWIENIAFNAAQGARYPNGEAICYLSSDNRFHALDSTPDSYSNHAYKFDPTLDHLWDSAPAQDWQHGGRFKFSPTHEDVAVCCNPNAVRLMPHYISRMWLRLKDGSGLAAYTYGPAFLNTEINGVKVTIEQVTTYPFAERVTFKISPEQDVTFSLYLRNPRWSAHTAVSAVNAQITEADGFYIVTKQWQKGDEVTVSFTAEVTAVLNVNGEYSVRRGPLQYALPIPHEAQKIKSYSVPDYFDYNLVPQDIKQAYQVIFLDGSKANLGLTVVKNEDGARKRPFDTPPIILQAGTQRLVPLGSALLRRATFPMIRSNHDH